MAKKKGSLFHNPYIFKTILILTKQACCGACLPLKFKSLEGSDKASSVYSR